MAEPLPPQAQLFDIPGEVAYLNASYMGPLPRASIEAGHDADLAKGRPWSVVVDDFFDPVERLRSSVGRIIGGDADGVAITSAVSYGMAVVAANHRVGPGERAVVLAEQFPSNVYAWRHVAERDGGEVHTVERPAHGDVTAALLDAIDERASIVAFAPCHWSDGVPVDVAAVVDRAHQAGAVVALDVCQWVGGAPIDVGSLGADYVAGAFYKFLLGPHGVGFLWVRPEHRDGTPIEFNWMNRLGSEDLAGLVDYEDTYRAGARRFDRGEVSNFSSVAVALASTGLILDWGVDRVAATTEQLINQLCDRVVDLGLRVPEPGARSPHMVGLQLPDGIDPASLATHLRNALVHVSVRGTAIRVSPHAYNTNSHIEHLLSALESALAAQS